MSKSSLGQDSKVLPGRPHRNEDLDEIMNAHFSSNRPFLARVGLSSAFVPLLLVAVLKIQPGMSFTATKIARCPPQVSDWKWRRIKSTASLNLFASNNNMGGEREGSSRRRGDKTFAKQDSSKNGSDEDDESFSNFLMRLSQLPLVENGNFKGDIAALNEKLNPPPPASSMEDARNPFLSPFSSLLNFDAEIIPSSEKELMEQKALNVNLDVLKSWDGFMTIFKQSFGGNETAAAPATSVDTFKTPTSAPSGPSSSKLKDDILKSATTSVESVLSMASTAVSPDVFSSMIKQARNVLKFQDDLIAAAKSVARDRGLDDSLAAERARNTTDYMASLVAVADQVLRSGYVNKEDQAAIGDRQKRQEQANEILKGRPSASTASSSATPLFGKVPSARAISYSEFGPAISTIAEMAWLSGGIYENQMLTRAHELGHSIVAEGISADVYWMITDSTENEADFRHDSEDVKAGKDIPVRTIVIRGFDASDERVDREQLFTEICNLRSRPFHEKVPEILAHRGLHEISKEVYNDIQKYITWSAPAQKIVLTGHSVGGTISILVTLMLARERGGKVYCLCNAASSDAKGEVSHYLCCPRLLSTVYVSSSQFCARQNLKGLFLW